MRVVIQRVSKASVSVAHEIVSEMETGLLILLGIEESDTEEDIPWLCQKILNLRIFNDTHGQMNISALDLKADIMVVSQFTLFASTKKGNRPSYIRAARPELAEILYNKFIEVMEICGTGKVGRGKFGAMMEVSLVNDGPVTIIIDTKNKE